MAADVPPDPDAGASGTQLRVARWLTRLGHDVDTIWSSDLPHLITHGNAHDLLEKPVGLRRAIRRKWRSATFDVVCVNQPMGYLAARDHQLHARPGVFIRWSMGLEFALEQALAEWLPKWGMRKRSRFKALPGRGIDYLLRRQERLAARYADGHVVLCDEDRDILVAEFEIPPDRVANVAQAPLEAFQALPPAPISLERLNRILTVGQFVPYKGTPHIAATVNRVLASNPAARFTWAGCGAEHREAALGLIRPELRSRCHVPGKLLERDFIDLFDTHGIFLFPSIKEGFGKAFLEAMSRGMCVVSTRTGGMRDIIVNAQNGFVAAPGDVDALVHGIAHLWRDPAFATTVAVAARRTAEQYTWDRVARHTVRFCRELLHRQSLTEAELAARQSSSRRGRRR